MTARARIGGVPPVEPVRPGASPLGPLAPGGPGPGLGAEPPVLQPPTLLTVGSVVQLDPSGTVVTSVSLVGSVDDHGLGGEWWFTYGTTPQMGTLTGASATAGTPGPITVLEELTRSEVVQGATYWFAVAATTPGGTLVAAPLTFTAAAPASPTSVTTVATQGIISEVAVPHFSWPFEIVFGTPHVTTDGVVSSTDGAAVVQQDSDGDVVGCVDAICACTVGQFPEDPSFGIPDYAFSQVPLDTAGLASSILRWEARATETVIESAVPPEDETGAQWRMDVEAGVTT